MTSATRNRLLWLGGLSLVLAGAVAGVRFWLGGYIVRSVLGMAGASQVRFVEVSGTPWRLEVRDLEFDVRLQGFAARRVVLVRDKWWQASLGDVRVEGARIVVVPDRSDMNPWSWSTYEEGGLGAESVQLPFRAIHVDGELVVRMGMGPDRAISFTLEGQPSGSASWVGSLVAEGPGFRLAGGGSLLRAGQELDFQVHSAALDLGEWSQPIQRLVVFPGGPWEMGGKLTGVGEGRVTAQRFAATARFSLREGRMRAGTQDVSAEGAELDLEFSDLWKLRSKPGALRLARLRVGRLELRDLALAFSLWNGKQFDVQGGMLAALGGKAAIDPFQYNLEDRMLAVTLRPAGLSAARLLDLSDGAVPRLGGRFDGMLPLRIHGDGAQVQPGGYLALVPGESADLQLNAGELMRSGAAIDEAGETTLKDIGRQLLVMKLSRLRLDVRPPGLPLGTSATVDLAGTVEGEPVSFIYHVNGMLERYLRILP